MMSVCLKTFFKEKGLRKFDSFRDCYIVSFSDDSQKYSFVTSGHYPDPDFYGTANEVIGKLREILPTTASFDLDKHKEKLLGCLKIPYRSREMYSEEKRIETGNLIYKRYGIYGLLYLVLFYSMNGNLPEGIPANKHMNAGEPNIYMASKKLIEKAGTRIEDSIGAEKIIMICYAGTTFLANDTVSNVYKYDLYEMYRKMMDKVEMHIALVDPFSPLIGEMVNYKMKPRTLINGIDMKDLIKENIKWLLRLMRGARHSKLNLYFVDFSLTVSYFQSVFGKEGCEKDSIKVDLYLPNFSEYETDGNGKCSIPAGQPADSELRQSFIVNRDSDLYSVFDKNIQDILSHSRKVIINSEITDEYKELIEDIEKGENRIKGIFSIRGSKISDALKAEMRQYLCGDLKKAQKLPFFRTSSLEVGMTYYEEKRCDEPHYHTTTEDVIYVLRGTLHTMDITTGGTDTFSEGDFVIVPVMTPYITKAEAGTVVIFVKDPVGNDKKLIDVSGNPEVVDWMNN